MKRQLALLAFATAMLSAPTQTAQAQYPSSFGGSDVVLGTSGTDAFGNTWRFKVEEGRASFGFPGLGSGTSAFAGPSSAYGLYIRFSLPGQAVIDQTPPVSGGGFELTTRFSQLSAGSLWNATFDADGLGVRFDAPSAATALDNSDEFFVNVVFRDFPVDSRTISFEGQWLGAASVPEPTSAALLALGMIGLATAARRRRA